MKSYMNIQ